METIWLHGPGDLVCLKDSFTFVVKAISMKMIMKQYHFILLVLINVHHMPHLIPIKIWNTWNLRFQALTTQNHDILETEANLPSVQQFFVKLPGQNIAEASVWYSHGWRTYYFTMLIVSLPYCYVSNSLLHTYASLSYLLVLFHWGITEYILISIATFSNVRRQLDLFLQSFLRKINTVPSKTLCKTWFSASWSFSFFWSKHALFGQ